MNVILIDDERKGREVLKKLLQALPTDIEIVGEADSVESGVSLLQNTECDILFLDIRMKDGTGFDLLEKLEESNFKLVFTTAYDQYAINAFKYNAIDYLLKPIDLEELENVINKINNQTSSSSDASLLQIKQLIKDELFNHLKDHQIAVPNKTSVNLINIKEIVRCEACSNYTYIHLANNTKIISTKTLKEFDAQLTKHNFCRIHNSHLVNLTFVKTIDKKGGIILTDGVTLEVSRRKKTELLNKISNL